MGDSEGRHPAASHRATQRTWGANRAWCPPTGPGDAVRRTRSLLCASCRDQSPPWTSDPVNLVQPSLCMSLMGLGQVRYCSKESVRKRKLGYLHQGKTNE